LPGREARFIHIPGYKCKGGGVVKVIIVVNPTGQVVEANIDPTSSSYSGDCLPTEALSSARKSVFFVKSDAPKRQTGSITFRFIPQ
jgi:outer membrane biosynthesis protein TonB